jgi:hypothetical protein
MVGGAVTHPAATPEPDVALSRHPALQDMGPCHGYTIGSESCGSMMHCWRRNTSR